MFFRVRLNGSGRKVVVFSELSTTSNEVFFISEESIEAGVIIIFIFVNALQIKWLQVVVVENERTFVLEKTLRFSGTLNHRNFRILLSNLSRFISDL